MEKEEAGNEDHSIKTTQCQQAINYSYYQRYHSLLELSKHLLNWSDSINSKYQIIEDKIELLANKTDEFKDIFRPYPLQKKKKQRRPADELHKSHICMGVNCYKQYASETSLRNHIKYSHPDLYSPRKKSSFQNNHQSS